MKRALLIVLCVAVFSGLAMSQTYYKGTGLGGVDKLGAHANGGRGCVGCHAPHSGGYGAGGNAGTSTTTDTNMGNLALWGQDMGPLYGQTFAFGAEGGFSVTFPAMNAFSTSDEEILGIMTCLSCHDGNIAKGAMMTNQSWEQKMGLLPTGANGQALYGPNPIPTLLGNDGSTAGNYNNDHPVGPTATLGAVRVASNFLYSATGCGGTNPYPCLTVNPAKTNYVNFMAAYGAPNIISTGHGTPVVLPDTDPNHAYVVCTTCHTPHSMYSYGSNADAQIAGDGGSKNYPSYFFIAAPYNPGSQPSATQASSATQFCRQCHFSGAGGSNENAGISGVTTAF